MKKFITLSAIAACSLLSSCKHEPQIPPVNCISLVDFSPSRDISVIRWYRETIQHSILESMGAKDRAIVLPIDFNSETSGQEIFTVDFSKNDYSNEYAGLQKDEIERQNHLDSVHAAALHFNQSFETVRQYRAQLTGGTDIFGALPQCKKYCVPGYRNIVVIFSDMLQYTNSVWNFEDHLNTPAEIEHYLSIAEKIDLDGVEIIVITGAQNDMRPEKYNTVKTFWMKYFIQCHARLLDYSSGATSKLEESLKK